MKRIPRTAIIAGAIVAAVSLVNFAPISQNTTQAGPYGPGYYGGYRSGYGAYSSYGYSPYGYGASRGYVYPSYGGYGVTRAYVYPSNTGYGYSEPYSSTPGTLYYGHDNRQRYNPYGYGGDRSYGGSPNFGHAYSPYGYGTYSAYGY